MTTRNIQILFCTVCFILFTSGSSNVSQKARHHINKRSDKLYSSIFSAMADIGRKDGGQASDRRNGDDDSRNGRQFPAVTTGTPKFQSRTFNPVFRAIKTTLAPIYNYEKQSFGRNPFKNKKTKTTNPIKLSTTLMQSKKPKKSSSNRKPSTKTTTKFSQTMKGLSKFTLKELEMLRDQLMLQMNYGVPEQSVEEFEEETDGNPITRTPIRVIPGTAGVDFPTLSSVPRTDFDCGSQEFPGIYADTQSDCQVFYICRSGGFSDGFLCPNGTVFNQQYFICDWWYNVNCELSEGFYPLNEFLYNEESAEEDFIR